MVDAVSSSLTSTLSPAAAVNQAAESAQSASADSDFDDFLTLLTAQLRHQDPLQPLDSTQFVEQLASFSAVEQQVGTNARLDKLVNQGGGGEISALASWIGREAAASNAAYRFGGDDMTVAAPAETAATGAAMAITDADGNEVARVAFDPGDESVTWDGVTAEGGLASDGLYTVRFHYTAEGREPWSRQAEAAGRVVEVRLEDDGARLVLDTGATVRQGDVTRLSEAAA